MNRPTPRFDVKVDLRSFLPRPSYGNLVISPVRWDHHVIGGPRSASLKATGPVADLWDILDWIRCPVTIRNPAGDWYWWGLVNRASLRIGAVTQSVSTDEMVNRLKLGYSDLDPGCGQLAGRATTSWSVDAASVAEYGVKELFKSIGDSTGDRAVADRDTALRSLRIPVFAPSISARADAVEATIDCVGWWRTLGWVYDEQFASERVTTTDQLEDIIHRSGQFLAGTDILEESGISSYEYQDGDGRALEIVEGLLATGLTDNRRLLATVMPDRRVRIAPEPPRTDLEHSLYLDGEGQIFTLAGDPIEPGFCPAGYWVDIRDLPPIGAGAHLLQVSPVFIDRAEYTVGQPQPVLEARGKRSPWDRPGYLGQG